MASNAHGYSVNVGNLNRVFNLGERWPGKSRSSIAARKGKSSKPDGIVAR